MKRILVWVLVVVFLDSCTSDIFSVYKSSPSEFIQTPYTLVIPDSFPVPLAPPVVLTEEGIALGKKLFYETLLSKDNTISCGSCHAQEYGFTDNGKDLSGGVGGLKGLKNSMPIMNLVYYQSFFWNGRAIDLPHQALMPVNDPLEMQETWSNVVEKLNAHTDYPTLFKKAYGDVPIDSTLVTNAIAQFELTFISANSEFDKMRKNIIPFTPSITNGLSIFNTEPRKTLFDAPGGDCFHCHSVPLFTSLIFENNGLDVNPKDGLMNVTGKASDRGKFKVPSLRNVEKTRPYMHDGRFQTLEEVVDFYNDGINISNTISPIMVKIDSNGDSSGIANGLFLTNQEKSDLIAFLKALTDEEFLTDPIYSNPN